MTNSASRNGSPLLTIGLAVLGVVLLIVGIVYFADSAASLPSFFPGHKAGSTRHHSKHAILAVILAVVCFAGAWMTTGKRTET